MGGPRRDAIVIGGGISGLTCAFRLEEAGLGVSLLEASSRVGGSIRTLREDGWVFELGPNTVLENDPHVGALVADAGLEDQKLVAAPAAKRRYLFKRGRLQPLPSGPLSFLTTRLFSNTAKARVVREPWVRPWHGWGEESVADFVRRRLGQEMLDYAVGPFVSGVYAGDPERLSVEWAVAKIHALEKEHGSLIRGAFARRKGPAPGGAMITMREGLEVLPRRLASRLTDVRTDGPAGRVTKAGAGFAVEIPGETLEADRVVLAVPADAVARLLADLTGGASMEFEEIPYAPIALVALGYRREDVPHALDGFGFLAPRREGLRILGCLFTSTIFPHRAPDGCVALAAFAGGRTDPDAVALDDDALLDVVTSDLAASLRVTKPPVFTHVRRWPRAIPQYELGHARFVDLAAAIEREHPGLHVGGNVLRGVSVPDCIRNANALARSLVEGRWSGVPRLPYASGWTR